MRVVTRLTAHRDVPPVPRPYRFVGLHHTATAVLATPHDDGSWHYQIDRAGTVWLEVPEELVAWHIRDADRWRPSWMPAGPGGFSDPNWCGIGIELVSDDGTYTEAQYAALTELLADIRARRGPLPVHAHGELQADKHDPAGFEWARIHKEEGRVDVPYITQLEGGNGYANCGPASLTMCLAYDGYVSPDQGQMHLVADYMRDRYYDGDWWLGTYTDFSMMEWTARDIFGVGLVYHSSFDSVRAALDAGRPVVILLDNSVLQPRLYPATAAWNAHHFIVLTGYDAADYRVNDPLAYYYSGPGAYSRASIQQATDRVGGVFAVSLAPPAAPGEDPTVIAELQGQIDQLNGINTELNNQVGALRAEIDGLNGQNTTRQGQIDALREELGARQADVAALSAQLAAVPAPVAPADVVGVVVRLSDGREVAR